MVQHICRRGCNNIDPVGQNAQLAFDNDWHELNTLQVKCSDLSVEMIDERPCTLENEVKVSKTPSFNSNMGVDT